MVFYSDSKALVPQTLPLAVKLVWAVSIHLLCLHAYSGPSVISSFVPPEMFMVSRGTHDLLTDHTYILVRTFWAKNILKKEHKQGYFYSWVFLVSSLVWFTLYSHNWLYSTTEEGAQDQAGIPLGKGGEKCVHQNHCQGKQPLNHSVSHMISIRANSGRLPCKK